MLSQQTSKTIRNMIVLNTYQPIFDLTLSQQDYHSNHRDSWPEIFRITTYYHGRQTTSRLFPVKSRPKWQKLAGLGPSWVSILGPLTKPQRVIGFGLEWESVGNWEGAFYNLIIYCIIYIYIYKYWRTYIIRICVCADPFEPEPKYLRTNSNWNPDPK